MDLNNLYNFRNTIRHFINIDSLTYPPDINTSNIETYCWTVPISFKIQKDTDKFRTIKLPNILNFVRAYYYYSTLPNFQNVEAFDPQHNRLTVDFTTGDFKSGEYDTQLSSDFMNLCLYDNLIKLDIHEFYGKIYTHYLDMGTLQDNVFAGLNNGRTGGILMGNYLSLYFAQTLLKKISSSFSKKLSDHSINCHFEYFSDDFYMFCNKNDIQTIKTLFEETLEHHDFECNAQKEQYFTYETYNNYNLLTRLWKSVIRHWNLDVLKDYEIANKNDISATHKLSFLNQIIYKLTNLNDIKQKKSFINNFFKTKHFQENDFTNYTVDSFNYHQLCFLFKLSPESLLYTSSIFKEMDSFNNEDIKEFLLARFKQSLLSPFNDIQLYFYYAIKCFQFDFDLSVFSNLVLKSKNQILISYYLMEDLFTAAEIFDLKQNKLEECWFQNYHLILFDSELRNDLENSITTYLIPKFCLKKNTTANTERKNNYLNFYKINLENQTPLINSIEDVTSNIKDYLNLRYQELEDDIEDEDWEFDTPTSTLDPHDYLNPF